VRREKVLIRAATKLSERKYSHKSSGEAERRKNIQIRAAAKLSEGKRAAAKLSK
jgi:hypothetical protein